MPMNRSLYPTNWDEIATKIKRRKGWKCQKCLRPCRKPGETLETLEKRVKEWPDAYEPVRGDNGLTSLKFKRGRFVLGVAHLDHKPMNCNPRNLRAWCSPCHCRYDLSQMNCKKFIKLELAGQLNLFSY